MLTIYASTSHTTYMPHQGKYHGPPLWLITVKNTPEKGFLARIQTKQQTEETLCTGTQPGFSECILWKRSGIQVRGRRSPILAVDRVQTLQLVIRVNYSNMEETVYSKELWGRDWLGGLGWQKNHGHCWIRGQKSMWWREWGHWVSRQSLRSAC